MKVKSSFEQISIRTDVVMSRHCLSNKCQYELTSSFDQMTFQNNVVLRNYDLSNKHGNSNTFRFEQMSFKNKRQFLNEFQYKLTSFQTNIV